MNAINAAYFELLYNYRYVQMQIVTTVTRPYSTLYTLYTVQFYY
jgi:hypothetical protein